MEKLTMLFSPGKMNKLELKNRIIMAPLGHGLTLATKDGFMTDKLIAFHEARAAGGVGMIQPTTSSLGPPFDTVTAFSPGVLTITDDAHVESAKKWVAAMHSHGTKASFSISHQGAALARAVMMHPFPDHPEWNRVVTSTGTKDPVTGFETHTLTIDEIARITEAFGQAAKRGKAAGFDAVRIQGCHAYLLRQFLSPRVNKRTDQYGGSIENRARFACEVIRSVRNAVGADFPIIMRMNGDEHFEGGIMLDEGIEHARLFVAAGADVLDVSSGPPEAAHWQYVTMFQPSGLLAGTAGAIKKATGATVICVGKINPLVGERILQEGQADFIQIGRGLMADPELPNKAREGRLAEIQPCIYCGHCQSGGTQGSIANCTVNPALGRESVYRIEPAVTKKKIVVIGGGPAGLSAAFTAAERGHQVTVLEKTARLGGQWKAVAGGLPDEEPLITYLAARAGKAGVRVLMNQAATAKMVQELQPDAVIIATGSNPAALDVPGIDDKKVVQAVAVLEGTVRTGRRVVIIGARTVGLTAALFLAGQGKEVSIITRGRIGTGISRNAKQAIIDSLIEHGVHLYPDTMPDSITPSGLNCIWKASEQPGDIAFFSLKADSVVLAVGAENENRLSSELKDRLPEVHTIGDASGKRTIFGAMREGHEVARKI